MTFANEFLLFLETALWFLSGFCHACCHVETNKAVRVSLIEREQICERHIWCPSKGWCRVDLCGLSADEGGIDNNGSGAATTMWRSSTHVCKEGSCRVTMVFRKSGAEFIHLGDKAPLKKTVYRIICYPLDMCKMGKMWLVSPPKKLHFYTCGYNLVNFHSKTFYGNGFMVSFGRMLLISLPFAFMFERSADTQVIA